MPLEVRVYGEKEGSFVLYDDDGKSYNYEKGAFSETTFHVKDKKGELSTSGKSDWSYNKVTWNFMSK